jgi:hypothetical protein
MRTRLYTEKKAASKSASTPITNPFQSRPFAPPTEASPQQQATPDLQAQQEKAKGLSYNFANVSVSLPNTSPRLSLQAKLTIGQPGDKYEQEADQVAAKVVSQINAPATKSIQRTEMPEEEELQMKPQVGTIQRTEMPEEEELQMKPMVQCLSAGEGMAATPDVEGAIQRARGSGQPLSDNIRQPMEKPLRRGRISSFDREHITLQVRGGRSCLLMS